MAIQDGLISIEDAIRWRWSALKERFAGATQSQRPDWQRLVMDRETAALIRALPYTSMHALEISGTKWHDFGFASYESVDFDEFDVCAGPRPGHLYDVIIVEQVLEHVLWPFRAVRHLHQMLRPDGRLLVTTPFMVKLHGAPVDCSRWTEVGLKHLLAEGGFPLESTVTGSWGNRLCVRRSLQNTPRGIPYLPAWHSLRHEPTFPVVVWALATKSAD